jgi:hypothetical protein
MTIELDTTLAQAEVLFLSFSQVVADIDRRRAEETNPADTGGLRHRAGRAAVPEPSSLPTLSDNLRTLLIAGR